MEHLSKKTIPPSGMPAAHPLVPAALCLACGFMLGIQSGCFAPAAGTVTGSVTYNGQPLEKGEITFSPTGQTGGTAGGEIAAGAYRVENLVPAEYQVLVMAVGELKIVGPSDPEAKRTLTDAEIRALIDPLPPDTTGKEQKLTVKRGLQTLDFRLQSKSKP